MKQTAANDQRSNGELTNSEDMSSPAFGTMCDLVAGSPKPSSTSSTNTVDLGDADVERRYFQEAFHTRTTFYVNQKPNNADSSCRLRNRSGQMYVEHLEPLSKKHDIPIVLIHDDFQTGQIFLTNPDGNPGWASFFLRKGYSVYIPDLPHCGRSNYHSSEDSSEHAIPTEIIERELTATAKTEVSGWDRSRLHDKWPGTGMRNDEIFENFRASLTPMKTKKTERENLSQRGLKALLQRSGRALLIGVGSGAVAAWLAADVVPDLVAGVVAIEPSGPPCGIPFEKGEHGYRTYSPFITPSVNTRKYGISDIPVTYFPALKPKDEDEESNGFLMNVSFVPRTDGQGSCARQNEIDCPAGVIDLEGSHVTGERNVRKLIHLQQMRHVVVTSHTGSHTNYDWATVNFLKDAGLDLHWMKLEDEGIFENGHLMFLEENSDQIASKICQELERMTRVLDVDPQKLSQSAKRRADGEGKQSKKKPRRKPAMSKPADEVETLTFESLTPMPCGTGGTEQPIESSPFMHQIDLPKDAVLTDQTDLDPSNVETDMASGLNCLEVDDGPLFSIAADQRLHEFILQNFGSYEHIPILPDLASLPLDSSIFDLGIDTALNTNLSPSNASSGDLATTMHDMTIAPIPPPLETVTAGDVQDDLDELFHFLINDEDCRSWEEVF